MDNKEVGMSPFGREVFEEAAERLRNMRNTNAAIVLSRLKDFLAVRERDLMDPPPLRDHHDTLGQAIREALYRARYDEIVEIKAAIVRMESEIAHELSR